MMPLPVGDARTRRLLGCSAVSSSSSEDTAGRAGRGSGGGGHGTMSPRDTSAWTDGPDSPPPWTLSLSHGPHPGPHIPIPPTRPIPLPCPPSLLAVPISPIVLIPSPWSCPSPMVPVGLSPVESRKIQASPSAVAPGRRAGARCRRLRPRLALLRYMLLSRTSVSCEGWGQVSASAGDPWDTQAADSHHCTAGALNPWHVPHQSPCTQGRTQEGPRRVLG